MVFSYVKKAVAFLGVLGGIAVGIYACTADDTGECIHSEKFKAFFEDTSAIIYNCCGFEASYCKINGGYEEDRCEVIFYKTFECPTKNIDKMIECCGAYENVGNIEGYKIWAQEDAWEACRKNFLETNLCIPVEQYLTEKDKIKDETENNENNENNEDNGNSIEPEA